MDAPQEGVDFTAIIVPVAGAAEKVEHLVIELGGEVRAELPFEMLRVDIPESALEELWSHSDLVKAIQTPDEEMQVLA